jgi:eukaryotic-like serine/threonine-protein kinase
MDPRRWQEIQATFDQLVELDVAERGSRLATLGNSDPALRAAVEAMLAADAAADAQLAPLEASLLASPSTPDLFGLSGRTIAHFRVQEPIGAGGMGVVYRAEDTRLGRPVALKFLLPLYSIDAKAKARFVREAKAGAALDHPNLCSIHEVGTTEGGQLFLAMPLYAGETLKTRLEREDTLPLNEVFAIARQVAEGLKSAHASGIVHRDLKPGNIMLLPDGSVKILDFGLAKAMDQSVTETAGRLGTAAYMAPEQVRGDAVDGRTDLWGLGVVLYEMLTGHKPFGGDDEIAVAHAIIHDEPDAAWTLRSDVPARLEDVVTHLLQKSPAARYASAAPLLADLAIAAQAAGRSGALASLSRSWRRSRRGVRAHRRWVVAAGASAAIGLIAYAAAGRQQASVTAPLRTAIAVLPFRNLSADGSHAYLASGLQEEIQSQLYKVPALKVIGRNSVMGYGGPNPPPVRQIAQELGVGSVVDASVQVAGNRVRVNVQLVDGATEAPLWVESYDRTLEDALALQSDIAQQIVATVGAALSGTERNALARIPTTKTQAYLLYLRGREYDRRPGWKAVNLDSAIASYEQAVTLDPDFALAHAALSADHGNMYWLRRDMTPARLARQRAEAEVALRLAPDLPQAHATMSAVHGNGPGIDILEGLKEIRIALRGAPNDAQLWNGVAASYRRLGMWEQYDEPFERAVQLDPRNVELLRDYGGFTHARMGRYAEAVRWYDRALTLLPDTADPMLYYSLDKAWVYVWWKGQLDTLRTMMRGGPGARMMRNGWMWHPMRFFMVERQADSMLQLVKWAHEVAPHYHVFQDVLVFLPLKLYAGWAHQLRGDSLAAHAAFDSALVVIDSAMVNFPEDWPVHQARGMALAGLGRRDEALREVRVMRESFIYRKDLFLRPYVEIGAAQILAHAGEADAAVAQLERLLRDPFPAIGVHELRLHPVWDPIRQHPRFKALLAKYGQV